MLSERKKTILKKVVEAYVKTAHPISSGNLVKKDFPKISSATLRNEMLDLTNEGFLFQPHTSAGKIPTESAFRFFLDNFVEEKKLNKKSQKAILQIQKKGNNQRKRIKELAKELAEQSGEAIIISFSKDDYFYTGLSNLFAQPEFEDFSLIQDLSEVIDHLDRTMESIFDDIDETKILMGEENPFSNKCSVILTTLNQSNQKVIIGLLGPLRMDYNRNISLIKFLENL
jgi:transcriptional regulator of heat shock response